MEVTSVEGGLQPRSTEGEGEGEGEPEHGREWNRSLLSEAGQSLKFSTRKGGAVRVGFMTREVTRGRGDGVKG